MLKKIFITGGIALAAYVLNSMRKEFDKNVSDYNDLVDKYNDLLKSKYGNHYSDSKEMEWYNKSAVPKLPKN